MRKAVVISCNNNPDYLFYAPIVTWAWNKIGWGTIIYLCSVDKKNSSFISNKLIEAKVTAIIPCDIEKYSTETVSQCIRLYAANNFEWYGYKSSKSEFLLMTSDVDMLPLSDYWKPNEKSITAYGRDLSDEHYPMCYLSMNIELWEDVMTLTGSVKSDLERDLNIYENNWTCDQTIITERLNKRSDVVRIDRGIDKSTGYPIGRCDRSSFLNSLKQKERVDAHLFRNGWESDKWDNLIFLLDENFKINKEELEMFNNYRTDFINQL
ncbi:MAG TPA: hypothetical protein PK431_14245 [Chitinophagales bacterium]|nr:hypothetical protein [Chitinophagales bacterium]